VELENSTVVVASVVQRGTLAATVLMVLVERSGCSCTAVRARMQHPHVHRYTRSSCGSVHEDRSARDLSRRACKGAVEPEEPQADVRI
jgi:hypothetical protein